MIILKNNQNVLCCYYRKKKLKLKLLIIDKNITRKLKRMFLFMQLRYNKNMMNLTTINKKNKQFAVYFNFVIIIVIEENSFKRECAY